MAETEETGMAAIHEAALVEFDNIHDAVWEERKQCLADRRFCTVAGAQWEGPLGDQFENKPKFEVNKTGTSVDRIISEYRNNRIGIDFISKDGTDSEKLADTCDGLMRADEQDSDADEAYDNSFAEAAKGGIGAWRYRAIYADEYDDDDDKQRIAIEPITDADISVFFDINSKRQDKRDAKSCFVITAMSPESYEEIYDDDIANWPVDVYERNFDWVTPDVVYVAEYYKVEEKAENCQFWKGLDDKVEKYTEDDFKADAEDSEEDGYIPLRERLIATGFKLDREKRIKRKRVHKYTLSGSKVLDDGGYIAGNNIPIVIIYGKRSMVDGIERAQGHVRPAKDTQRLGNMQRSKLAETSALSSVEKPILMPEQMSGHAEMWSDDNIKNYPYLLINPITNADGQVMPSGPLAYTKVPNIPPAMAALLQITEQDMKDLLGDHQAGEKVVSNISEKTVTKMQGQLDVHSFIYLSNFAKARKRGAEIWLGMASDLYVEDDRKMKSIDENGKASSIELMRNVIGEGGEEKENDMSEAKFDVVATVGPSSSSKRAATVAALTDMMGVVQDPETMQVLSSVAAMNIEGEGVEELRPFFRKKLLAIGAAEPTEEEAAEMAQAQANQEPTANDKYLESAAREADAAAQNKNADTISKIATADKTEAETVKVQAETVEITAEIDQAELMQALAVIDRFSQQQQAQPQQVAQPVAQPAPIQQEVVAPEQGTIQP
ncbi:MAG: portal protein [Desulfobacterales bacterium]